jgi:polysaccharide export outer membrane protein
MSVGLCAAFLYAAGNVSAQSTGGGSGSLSDLEQQVFQGMSPEQRDAVVNSLGNGLGGGVGGQGGLLGNRRQGDQSQQQNDGEQQAAAQRQRAADQQQEKERLSPYLQTEDWIVITIDSTPLPSLSRTVPVSADQSSSAYGVPPSALAGLQQNPQAGAVVGAAAGGMPATGGGSSSAGTTAGGYAPPPPPGSPAASAAQAVLELTEDQKKQRDHLIDLIRSKNPYQLTRDGELLLPGFAAIPLAGLTEDLATLRLGSEPALRQLFIRLTKLPLKKLGPTALKPFGYDLFDRPVSTFAPVTNVPVPSSYVVGAGDQLEVQLYGNQNKTLYLTVGRDGQVLFPELGPISVAGMTFDQARAALEGRVTRQMIGVRASVSMGDTRSIRVFVLGDVKRPGSYTISGLGTITSALFAAGGVQRTGSLRKIQLKRRGELIRQLDVYDMLIHGSTVDDEKLLPGDVVFIPSVGPTIAIDGEVRRPAIYELRGESSVADAVELAGGLSAEADRQKAALTRIDESQRRIVVQVDLTGNAARQQGVRDGDALRIPHLRPTLDAGIVIEGYTYATGAFPYHEGVRLTDVIRSADDLRPNADLHYVLIRRELPPDRHIVVLSADLQAALNAPGSPADVVLLPRDRITVFDLQASRDRVIEPLMDDLRLQSSNAQPTAMVRIEGRVKVPGEYPLEQNMTVRDLVRAGGSLTDAAYGAKAELTRYKVVDGESRRTDQIEVDLAAAIRGDPAANVRLEPFDSLSVKEVQAWDQQEEVTLLGEVRFPGTYSIKRGETLKSVVMRAGGLTDLAFVEGAVFTRKELQEREQQQIDNFARRMQSDIAFMALQSANSNQGQAGTALTVGQSLLDQLKSTKAVGRLVINLQRTLGAPVGATDDIMLRGGDKLLIPKYQQEVTVVGEVQNTTSHLFHPGLSRDDYIALSGGESRRADNARVYVVRADGSVIANEGARWFRTNSGMTIKPGDTVVVPLNAEHLPTLPLWQAVTQIIYNVAIAAAAVHSF